MQAPANDGRLWTQHLLGCDRVRGFRSQRLLVALLLVAAAAVLSSSRCDRLPGLGS